MTQGASKKVTEINSRYLIYSPKELTGEFVMDLLLQAITLVMNDELYIRSFFVNGLAKKYSDIPTQSFETYFENFCVMLRNFASNEEFKKMITSEVCKRGYLKASYIMESKEIRDLPVEFFEGKISKKILNSFLAVAINCMFLEMGIVKKEFQFKVLAKIVSLGIEWMTSFQKQKLMCLSQDLDYTESFLSKIDSMPIPQTCRISNEEIDFVHRCFKKSLIDFYLKNHLLIAQYPQSYLELIEMISDIFANRDIILYLSKWENSMAIIEKLFSCLVKKRIVLTTMTCPDYSGYYSNDNSGKQTWVFDFESLGDGEGIVAQKAYPYIMILYSIFKRYIANVEISHNLPTTEFSIIEGFKNGTVSKNETTQILKQSLLKIQKRYIDEFGVDVKIGLSNDVIFDELFEQQRIEIKEMLYKKYTSDSKFKEFVAYVLKERKGMYYKWYPRLTIHETEKDYQVYLLDCAISQIADYMIEVWAYTAQGDVFMVYSDSPILAGVWRFANAPALSGQGVNSITYAG